MSAWRQPLCNPLFRISELLPRPKEKTSASYSWQSVAEFVTVQSLDQKSLSYDIRLMLSGGFVSETSKQVHAECCAKP